MKGIQFRHLQIGVGVLILGVLIFTVDFTSLSWGSISIFSVNGLLAILFLATSLLPRAMRWAALMNAEPSVRVSLSDSLRFLLVGSALNMVMPAGAGDVAKSYFGYRWTGIKERMLAVSLYDKLIAIASLLFLSLFAFAVTKKVLFLLAALISASPWLIVEAFPYLVKIPWFEQLETWAAAKLKTRIDLKLVLDQMKFSWQVKLRAIAFSLAGWVLDYGLLYLCFLIMNSTLNPAIVFVNGPLITLGRLFPFTLNGLGSDEALMVLLFSSNGNLSKEAVLMTAILYRIIVSVMPALAGVFFISAPVKRRS